jgi:hypothetical protein
VNIESSGWCHATLPREPIAKVRYRDPSLADLTGLPCVASDRGVCGSGGGSCYETKAAMDVTSAILNELETLPGS